MNKVENINLLPDTEPDSGDYTGEDVCCTAENAASPKKPTSRRARRFSGLPATRQSATARRRSGLSVKLPNSSADTLTP